MLNQQLNREHRQLQAELVERNKAGQLKTVASGAPATKRRRWDQSSTGVDAEGKGDSASAAETPTAITPSGKRWGDDTATPVRLPPTPGGVATPGSRSQWEETPGRPKDPGATPGQSVRYWAETPGHLSGAATPGRDALGASALGVSCSVMLPIHHFSYRWFSSSSVPKIYCSISLPLRQLFTFQLTRALQVHAGIGGMKLPTRSDMVRTPQVDTEQTGQKRQGLTEHPVGLSLFKIPLRRCRCTVRHLRRPQLLQSP